MPSTLPALSRTGETWWLSNASVTGGPSLAGTQQVAANPASFWRGKLTFKLKTTTSLLAARGFVAGLDGMFGSFAAGPVDWRGQPWFVEGLTATELTPGLAKRAASNNPGLANGDTSGLISFTLAQPVAANSVVLNLTRVRGGFVRVGQYLQIGDRLHVVVDVPGGDSPDPTTGQARQGAGVTVSVRPWTRAAYPAGMAVNFSSPTSLMRLVNPEQAVAEIMSSTPQADLQLELIEAL